MAITTPPTSTRLTYEAYLTEEEINRRYDIIDGVRIFMASPSLTHQEIAMNISEQLRAYQRATGRGRTVIAPFDVLIRQEPLNTRQPDVLFISKERLEQAGGPTLAAPLTIAPELVVEILSSSETQRTIGEKIADYVSIGVQECWLVYPDTRTVEVLRLTPTGPETAAVYMEGQNVHSLVFHDLILPVADIFNR